MSRTINILSRHATLAAAVAAAGLDLSYNEASAKSTIANADRPHRGGTLTEAFVVEGEKGKEVLYTYKCDILLLNKFEPFFSCLDDSAFHLVSIKDSSIEIFDAKLNRNARKAIANAGLTVTTL